MKQKLSTTFKGQLFLVKLSDGYANFVPIFQDIIPKSHLADYKFSDDDMKLIKVEELEETEEAESAKGQRQRLGMLMRAIDRRK